MTLNEMIALLEAKRDEMGGDKEVLITDGYECRCYKGNYFIGTWVDEEGRKCVDIGIGGCEQ